MPDTDITVLIPLHESAAWRETVHANLARLAGHVAILVSDATGRDDTLPMLTREWGGRDGITFFGPRSLRPGWVAHYNDLVTRVRTPRFLWLAHDDEIDADHVAVLSRMLDEHPAAAGACGLLQAIEGPGLIPVPQPRLPPPATDRFRCRANQLLFEWNFGVAFRGLFRRERVRLIPTTTPLDEWADLVWLYGVCLEHPLVQTDRTVYRKRFTTTSTHAAWRARFHPLGLPYLVREIARCRGLDDPIAIVDELVALSIMHYEQGSLEAQERISATFTALAAGGGHPGGRCLGH
jgi:hypothetical protein